MLDIKIKKVSDNLKKYTNKEITEEEFNINNALFMVADIDNMKFKIYPSRPQELIEYMDTMKEMKAKRKSFDKRKIQDDYFNLPVVKRYQEQYGEIESKNSGNYYWLHWCKRILGEDFYEQIDPLIEDFRSKDDNYRKYNIN